MCLPAGSTDHPGAAAGVAEIGARGALVCFRGASGGPLPGLPTWYLSFCKVGSEGWEEMLAPRQLHMLVAKDGGPRGHHQRLESFEPWRLLGVTFNRSRLESHG